MEFGPVVAWLALHAVLGALGLPVAARLFRRLDGRGAALALPVSLVVVFWGVYWVGQVRYGPVASVAGLGLLGAVATAATLDATALREGRVEVAVALSRAHADGGATDASVRIDPQAVRQAVAVFLLAFGLVVWMRALDPAVHPIGGEKFLDFGLLRALDRADYLPPEDFWFAGRRVAYYYGGHLVAATLGDLTGTPSRLTYNLALASAYATLVTAVYGLTAALGRRRGLDRRLAGGTAAVLVGGAANLEPAARVVLDALPTPVARPIAARIAARAPDSTTSDVLADAGSFHYFDASRVIPGTINEFPLFAWLNGDLHAHMTSTPFLVLAVAIGAAYYATPAGDVRRRQLLAFGALPLVAGVVAVVNTWSFPTTFGVLWLALAAAPTDPLDLLGRAAAPLRALRPKTTLGEECLRPALAALPVLVAVAGAGVAAAPFLLGSVAGAAGDRSIELLPAVERSGLGGLLLVHGVFLAGLWAYLLDRTSGRRWPTLLAVGAVAVAATTARAPVLLLVGPVLVLGWAALRLDADVGYETALAVGGAGLVALVEFVFLREQAGPLRMNTVFKTYAQVWVLWSVAGGVALPAVATRVRDGRLLSARTRRTLRVGAVALLLASASVYAALALSSHAASGRAAPTLDATAFVEERHPAVAPAIAHLNRVEGTPTMLSAPATSIPPPGGSYPADPGMYRFTSSPGASLTGVPTVAGWHHEVGYRGREAYVERVAVADEMYVGSPERRVALMRDHDVRYVWVGPAERARYGTVSFARIDGLDPVVTTRKVTLYRVDRDELAVAT